MLALWNALVSFVFDAILGWLRAISPDAALVAVAVLSALALTLVRRFTTDQDLLTRVAQDRRRLRDLRRSARRAGDRQLAARRRRVLVAVGQKALRAEVRPLFVSLLPIAALATWSFLRLEFRSPRDGEPVTLRLVAPVSAAGRLAHVVPDAGIDASVWIVELMVDTADESGDARAAAEWTLRGRASEAPRAITVRAGTETFEHALGIAPAPPGPARSEHRDGAWALETDLAPVDLWGLAPHALAPVLPPWLLGYLFIVIPATWACRRLLRVR